MSDTYGEIIMVLQCIANKKGLDRFKMRHQTIADMTMQELIDSNYDVELLINDIKDIIINT